MQPVRPSEIDLGPAPRDLPAGRVLLFLNRTPEKQAELDALVREQNDASSPRFHGFLTPAEAGRQFGLPDAALVPLTAWLAANGLPVKRILSSRLAVEVSGSVPQLEAAFQTSIHAFASAADPGVVQYANVTPARIPEEFGALVKGISLSNLALRPLNHSLGRFTMESSADPRAKPLYNIPNGIPCAPTGVCYGLVPGDVATIYDTKPLLAAGIDGTGVTIGIVGTTNIDLPTIQRFRTLFLPKYAATNLPNVIVDGTDPGLQDLDPTESYIDVETAGSVAPNATINFYTAANSYFTNGLLLALARAVEDNAVSVLSVSYGACEAYLGSYNSTYRDLYEEAAAQGITVVASSGDRGAADCDPPPNTSVSGPYQAMNGLGVNGLASTPYNIAVGGTDFLYPANATAANFNQYWNSATATAINNNADWSSARGYVPEKPWDDSDPVLDQVDVGQFVGGGGGESSCAFNGGDADGITLAVCQGGYPKPAWQQGFGNDAVRDVPDVSFFSGIGSNYSFYVFCITFPFDFSSTPECAIPNAGPNSVSAPIEFAGFGGTSVAAPLMAGILGLVAQATKTPRLGLATPTLYPLSKQFPAAFHDIATGTNAMQCMGGSPNCGSDGLLSGYTATAGYDLATGLGSVDAAQLVDNWAKVTTTAQATTTALSLTPVTAPHGTVVTFTVNVAGSSTNPSSGTIAIYGGTTAVIQTTHECAAFPCSFTFGALPGGTYPVTARFLADGTYAASTSAPVTVTIAPEASKLLIFDQFNNAGNYSNDGNGNGLNGVTTAQLDLPLGFIFAPVPLSTLASTSFFSLTAPPATGLFTITDFGVPIGPPMQLDSAGSFGFTSTSFGLGAHSLVVHYAGDSSYAASDTTQPLATPLNFTVVKAVSSGIVAQGLSSSPDIPVGYPQQLSIYVYGDGYGVNPTGSVAVTVNGTTLPAVPIASDLYYLSDGQVAIPGSLIVLGTNTILISYAGDDHYQPISTTETTDGILFETESYVNVLPATTSAGLPLTFYLEVDRNYQQAYPQTIAANVSVTLLDGTTPFATVPLAADTTRSSADGTYAYSGLTEGTHTITVQYPGDVGDLPSSGSVTVVITPGIPSFVLSATPVSFPAGASSPSAVSTLTLTPMYGFAGAVSLTCSAASLPGGRCNIPLSVSVSGNSPSAVPVTISSQGNTAQLMRGRGLALLPISACLFVGLGLFGTRRQRGFRTLLSIVGIGLVCGGLGACGGVTIAPVVVAAGTYVVSVQATSGAISMSTNINVTVK
jgi:hypothetical protein